MIFYNQSIFLLVVLCQSIFTSAYVPVFGENVIIYKSCYSAMNELTFGKHNLTYCSYPPMIGTLIVCINDHSPNEKLRKQALAYVDKTCKSNTDHQEIYNNATEYLDSNGYFNYLANDTNASPSYSPMTIPVSIFSEWHEVYSCFYQNYNRSSYYGYAIISYWFLCLIIAMVFNFFQRTGLINKFYGPVSRWIQSKLIMPTLFNTSHKKPLTIFTGFSVMLPARLEFLTIMGYFILHIVFLSIGWSQVDSNHPKLSTERMLAARTGVLAVAHFPLMFLFAGKNNFLSSLTGIPYDSFLHFHRATARVMAIDSLIHAVCYIHQTSVTSTWTNLVTMKFGAFGILALVACWIMVFFSGYSIRARMYEIFLVVHIVLAVVFVVGAWRHTAGLGYQEYTYTAVALWVFDRLLRVLRIIQFGFGHNTQFDIVSEDTVRIVIDKPNGFAGLGWGKFGQWDITAGQYCYCYFSFPGYFYQSHPFTATTFSSSSQQNRIAFYVKRKTGVTDKLYQAVAAKKFPKVFVEGPYGSTPPIFQYKNNLLIAGGNGIPGPFSQAVKLSNSITSMEMEECSKTSRNVQLLWISQSLESVKWFEKQILSLAASPTVKVVLCLTQETKESLEFSRSKTPGSPISAVQSTSSLYGMTPFTTLSDKINATNESSSSTPAISSENEKTKSQIECNDSDFEGSEYTKVFRDDEDILDSAVIVRAGRPNIHDFIGEYLGDGDDDSCYGSVSISSCGPAAMCDSIRQSISSQVIHYKKGRVDYFEESQAW
ncbi:hypothetical protein DASC09_060600 [Saccharomycopsis crataegensis]|uniref:FAD-binding FR-type domain-containing protein n=1 Tax=Saccharomycopsis crataegensis TaxID=43959 RepID=A0AAV5QW80_9ASCO|nr:hypothetical protein DASC09_060600 [Saccharomycopsis crataegensis]